MRVVYTAGGQVPHLMRADWMETGRTVCGIQVKPYLGMTARADATADICKRCRASTATGVREVWS
jgi:hypothetical protein